jgi:hypothetical protein
MSPAKGDKKEEHVSIRDEGRGVGPVPAPGASSSVGISEAPRPDDRARANLALLYGGAGLGPIVRAVIAAPARGRGMAIGGASARC